MYNYYIFFSYKLHRYIFNTMVLNFNNANFYFRLHLLFINTFPHKIRFVCEKLIYVWNNL